jgi:secondary thiamine-phosphate synthase enzyme
MITLQYEVTLSKKPRGFHLVTDEITHRLEGLETVKSGLAHIFLKHTSASLSINENADPTVRKDMERFFTDLADNKPYYIHTYEGDDDMPAHIKNSVIGTSLTIPVTNGRLNLGTWQGIYLNEHRDFASSRSVVVTIQGV